MAQDPRHGTIELRVLDQVVLRAGADGFLRNTLVVQSGTDDHRRFAHDFDHRHNTLDPRAVGQREVEQHGIDRPFPQDLQSTGHGIGMDDLDVFRARVADRLSQEKDFVRIVLNQERCNRRFFQLCVPIQIIDPGPYHSPRDEL